MTYVSRATQFNHQQALMHPIRAPEHKSTMGIRDRVFYELRKLGMREWGLWRFDVRYLPSLIHENEHIQAVAYGNGPSGSGMLVATNLRVLFVSKRPMYAKADELTYDIIGGVSYSDIGIQATVVLHSRMGDFKLRTFNLRLAQGFRDYIEERCLTHQANEPTHMDRYDTNFA